MFPSALADAVRRPTTRTVVPDSPHGALLAGDLVTAVLTAVCGCWWLAWLHSGDLAPGSPAGSLSATVAALSLALPLVMVTVAVVTAAGRRWRFTTASAVLTGALASALAVTVGRALEPVLVSQSGVAGEAFSSLAGDAALALLVTLPLLCLTDSLRGRDRAPRLPRAALLLAVGVTPVLAAIGTVPSASAVSVADGSCLSGGPANVSFDVTALDVDITVNHFGDHDPTGKMYALTSAIPAIRAQEAAKTVTSGLHNDPIQPLVIRANEGDCVSIRFTNQASGGDFGVHIDGLEFLASSSGDAIGANPTSAVATGQTTTYRFAIPDDPRYEGGHYLHPGPGHRAAVDHGLFGALVVEPPGSTYFDAETPRTPLASGWEAIIKPTGVNEDCIPTVRVATCGFREGALLHHEIGNDNESLTDAAGRLIPIIDELTYRAGSFAMNYRSEAFGNRLHAFPKEKSHAYSSLVFGEPATPIMRGYLADPTKLRVMHAGGEKFHIFHLHGGGDRWRFDPLRDSTFNYADSGLRKEPETALSPSQRLDSQSIGPGESYNMEIEGGAGGVQQSVGDFLYHCHIAKHYVAGMWGLWRVYDTRQPDLVPLSDHRAPPAAVDSRGLLGRTVRGTNNSSTIITRSNIDSWIRPQLPPQGVPADSQDASVWDWKVDGGTVAPMYLGAPADPTVFPDSVWGLPGQPNLLAVDAGHLVGNRPAILFNPNTGRPAYPMLRTAIGKRPPFTGAGHTGTPFLGDTVNQAAVSPFDPYARRADGLCPSGHTLRKFNVVTIAKPIRRSSSVVDANGKLFVLAKDKAATLADPQKGEPLAIRANAGDCVAVTLTNTIPDASAFDGFSKSSIHIHHVQFDVQGSDGVSAGFAYENSVRPYTVMDPTLTAAGTQGQSTLRLSNVAKLVGLDANGRPTHPWIAVGEGLESIEIHQVGSVDLVARTLTLTSALTSDHAAGEFAGTEFIQSRWYADAILDNVFWHDHVDGVHGWGHGLVGQLIIEPPGSTFHDPTTGAEVDSGALVDVHTSSPLAPGLVDGSFRELVLWTINDNDKDDYATINLKASPLSARSDPANRFSSYTYGDPATPLPRLYPDDPLVVRTINVSPVLDSLHFQGARTLSEPRDTTVDALGNRTANGTLIDTVHYGVSEKFTLVFNADGNRMRPGDYLYVNGNDLHTQLGAWGLVRVLPGRVPDLRPLPGVAAPSQPYVLPTRTGNPPPAAAGPGNPCPPGAPPRSFDVTALRQSGQFDGGRTAFVPDADLAAVQQGSKQLGPLVLHVVAGDCVTVRVSNRLSAAVSFSVGKLDREAGSGGVNAGFAPQQNIAPGATRSYVYFVPTDKIGSAVLADLAGARTLKEGLYGAVVVSPRSTDPSSPTWFSDPVTGEATSVGAQVLVHAPGHVPSDYRDFTVTIADDDAPIGQDFMPYPTNAKAGRTLVNYAAAPPGDGNSAFVDPGNVPWLTAYAGDPVTVHAVLAPGSERAHVFSLGGLGWLRDPFIADTDVISAQGMAPWETEDADIIGGAGGPPHAVGDFFYGDLRRPFTQAGVWGLQRVLPFNGPTCPIRRVTGAAC